MARASKRPESANFQFRKRIPPDVWAVLRGPTHVKESLRTRDPEEAKRLFREAEARYEARWAQVRLGDQHLDDMQVAAVAGEFYRDLFGKVGNMRGPWGKHSWSWFKHTCALLDQEEESLPRREWIDRLDRAYGERLNKVTTDRGMSFTGDTWCRLLVGVHRAAKLASETYLRQAEGDWSPDANLAKFPDPEVLAQGDPKTRFDVVWDAWLTEAKPSAGTVRRWKPVMQKLFSSIGTDDLSKVDETMLSAWIDGLIQAGLHNNTVSKVHLAAVKRVFSFAKRKKVIAIDPSADLQVDSGKKFETQMRAFNAREVAIVLRATMRTGSGRASRAFEDARRWVPWICAYTGARVAEVTQARACDFSVVDGMTVFHIRAEAGTAKTGDRDVPLHTHIIEQGFMEFLATKSGEQPLFYRPRKAIAEIPPYQEMSMRLAKWVRRLGIVDVKVDPNHAWRHRYKGYSAKAGNDERVTDALQGHAPSTQGRRYGEVDLEERITAIRKLPKIEIGVR